MQEVDYIWKNGAIIPWAEATVHLMTHGLHYGTSFFEGIRVYETPEGPAVFRLKEHIQRLHDTAKIYGLKLPYSVEEIIDACCEVITKNNLKSAYIRPIAYVGYGSMLVAPKECTIDLAIAAFPWGAYLGEEGLNNGIDVCVSSWNRAAPNTIPTLAKAGGNYLSGFLICSEAHERGFDEGIGLTVEGKLSEGAGENLFLIKDGVIYTPDSSSSILSGITRNTIITLAKEMGYEVREQAISREALYLADEIFFTGTAAEVTPVRSVDKKTIGSGTVGPITKNIQNSFFSLFNGTTTGHEAWLHIINASSDSTRKSA
ncbi:MAG: branched-chain amino acid transaminase [Pseudomonadota bacterium]|nr:branched-chain amino acid transaminase [Alphaproteobacteria bacterium]MEC7703082.1 branched-chain amino acid transaminase [Pseudomonadota bacterium]MEC9236211.1 branched-chain amino acid transaminase [Pseudomonadota bacterium]MED5422143.1 branched-chain amino acid transaminase [Pseudomonadota bacterium]